jgi:hypothetical protein
MIFILKKIRKCLIFVLNTISFLSFGAARIEGLYHEVSLRRCLCGAGVPRHTAMQSLQGILCGALL